MYLARIRIYWIIGIIGYSGFPRRASSECKTSSIFVLAGFSIMAKNAGWANEILQIPIRTKTRGRPPRPCRLIKGL